MVLFVLQVSSSKLLLIWLVLLSCLEAERVQQTAIFHSYVVVWSKHYLSINGLFT